MDVAQNRRDGKDDHVENFNRQFMGVKIFEPQPNMLSHALALTCCGCIRSDALTHKNLKL